MARVQLPEVDDASKSLEMSSVEIVRARRAATVPQQLIRSQQLPALASSLPLPRRYEDTKPAFVQNLSHQRIIALGELINKEYESETEKRKQQAVEQAVNESWRTAQELREQAVKDAVSSIQSKHEKQLRRLSRQNDRAIKEEAARVEKLLQNEMKEALDMQKEAAEKHLELTVQQVEAKCAAQLREAVLTARKEEQEEAHRIKQILLREAADTLEATRKELMEEKERELLNLTTRKDEERRMEVESEKNKAELIRTEEIEILNKKHAAAVDLLKEEILATKKLVQHRDSVIAKLQSRREQLYDELVKVHADYQDFINRHPMFDPGQTTYLLPDFWANSNVPDPRSDMPAVLKSQRKST